VDLVCGMNLALMGGLVAALDRDDVDVQLEPAADAVSSRDRHDFGAWSPVQPLRRPGCLRAWFRAIPNIVYYVKLSHLQP
jgi:hypothetical protein